MPKELHVPLVWLDGEVALGPAVYVCLLLCVRVYVCMCASVLVFVFTLFAHLTDARIFASVSIRHMYS